MRHRFLGSDPIRDAALGRLVFLVSPKGEEIGFEIRSLQEFMAAKALMSGTDEEIGKRLEAIAPYSFWRNVFLFASGKCARDRPYLTKQIVGICQTLNTDADNQAAVLTLLGSHLALDLLEDDTFRHHKKTVRVLTDIALNLLKLPPGEVHGRLASVCRPMSGLDDQFSAAIVQRLGMEDQGFRMAAWTVLVFITESGQGWAEGIVKDHWPSDISSQADLLEYSPFLFYGLQSGWIASKVVELIPHIGLTRIPPLREEMAGSPLPKWLTCVMRLHHGPGKYRRHLFGLRGKRVRWPVSILSSCQMMGSANGLTFWKCPIRVPFGRLRLRVPDSLRVHRRIHLPVNSRGWTVLAGVVRRAVGCHLNWCPGL